MHHVPVPGELLHELFYVLESVVTPPSVIGQAADYIA